MPAETTCITAQCYASRFKILQWLPLFYHIQSKLSALACGTFPQEDPKMLFTGFPPSHYQQQMLQLEWFLLWFSGEELGLSTSSPASPFPGIAHVNL